MGMRKDEDENKRPSDNKSDSNKGLVRLILTIVFSTTKWLVISCFVSICVSLICCAFIWPELGAERDRQTLIYESAFLAGQLTENSYVLNWILSYQHSWFWNIPEYIGVAVESVAGIITTNATIYAQTSVFAAKIFIVRVLVLAGTMPLAIASCVGAALVGLTERDLRRYNLARESSTKFHFLFNNLHLPLIWLVVAYLSWPASANPLVFLGPGILMLTILVFATTAMYKKYF